MRCDIMKYQFTEKGDYYEEKIFIAAFGIMSYGLLIRWKNGWRYDINRDG